VIGTLVDLKTSSHDILTVEGVLSGTLAFVLGAVAGGAKTLSAAVVEAKALGYTEPDPRDDLNGADVRRKVVVRAREMGLDLKLDDVSWDGALLPAALESWVPDTSDGAPTVAAQLLEELEPYDDEIASRVRGMCADGMVPVQLSVVDAQTGSASIKLARVDADARVARCSANENIVEISSRRYDRSPMVLQGPGAGAGITASGLFADVLKLSRTLVDWNVPDP